MAEKPSNDDSSKEKWSRKIGRAESRSRGKLVEMKEGRAEDWSRGSLVERRMVGGKFVEKTRKIGE